MNSGNQAIRGGNARTADIARLWMTLTTEYIPKLRIEVEPHHFPNGDAYVEVLVVDYASIDSNGRVSKSVWATRQFRNDLYLISHNQLFDLLISAYRVIDEFFVTGIDNRPRPPQG